MRNIIAKILNILWQLTFLFMISMGSYSIIIKNDLDIGIFLVCLGLFLIISTRTFNRYYKNNPEELDNLIDSLFKDSDWR